MSLSSAPCRCCRGLLHRLSGKRTLTSTAWVSAEQPQSEGGFKLPNRDWSVRPPQPSGGASKKNNAQGQRRNPKGRGSDGKGDSNGGPSNRRSPSGRGERDGFSKWGVSRDGPRSNGNGPDISLASGFGLKSAKPKDQRGGGIGDIIDKTRKSDRTQRMTGFNPRSKAPSAFGDLLGGAQEREGGKDRKQMPGKNQQQSNEDRPAASPIEEVVLGEEGDSEEYAQRRHTNHRRRRDSGGSLLSRLSEEEEASLSSRPHHNPKRSHSLSMANTAQTPSQTIRKPKPIKAKVIEEEKQVYIPRTISTANLAKIFGVKLFNLQTRMSRLDMTEDQRRSDYLLNAEQACDIAIEYGFDPVVDDEASFDIYPDPDTADGKVHPLRPPVVTIMGHVDHGKTTLLDSLRHTSVAAGEAGGITQHIGAFSVPLSSLLPSGSVANSSSPTTITFLDTPGHAAFTAMRARGASVTDIVVLVVAADDGVMPQTREVLELVKSEGDKVGLVVAINKCDKPGVDFEKVKSALGAEGIHLEEDGGDTPSVKVSGLAKIGLDDLVETLSTLAEIRDLRARREGKAEGYVLESRVDRGRGNVATVLVTRGILRTGSSIVAGQTWCRVRQMQDDKGKPLKEALPGTPVSITGWKELPSAGDELLEALKGEDEAKKAINNRKRDEERKRLMADVEQINIKRKEERMRLEAEAAALEALELGESPTEQMEMKREEEKKFLRLVIKADVSGTVEAVVGSLEHIGNKEAGVKVVHTGVGEVVESDVSLAEASDATIIGFNVPASRSIQTTAKSSNVPLHLESVIYRLIDTVRSKVAGLLPPKIEYSVKGEATVQQIFEINLKRKTVVKIAGCRVNNGIINKLEGVRVLRGKDREVVYEGKIEMLKHLKKEVGDVRKGMECGIQFEGFDDVREGDEIVGFVKVEVAREL
ncbi:translation initiation factor IF-2 [Kwoniella bestiolae CBS 10118]|uniref:Translation initiation factor IF-2, mitochondrial n=1 Tax=Kwoniella bestiolae CBS 10118 TaxID=1296100 RepID=A0A1B9GDN7_9TREE|nr:translation initiation factor IF-2 [Kwoniella bestiolae CBS 10118]OCF29113.1 translation initiation factor IF-2 [Kwoniella bestiolae CBS 10118]